MNQLALPLAIGAGGFVGALARFYVSGLVAKFSGQEFSFVGTLTVNLLGCFLIGLLSEWAVRTTHLSPLLQKCLITGLLGSLTTFSTFSLETMNLLQENRVAHAFMHGAINVAAGLLLVWLGVQTAAQCFPVAVSNDESLHVSEINTEKPLPSTRNHG